MYYYVEYLRATRALRIIGIILGILLLAGIIFRLAFIHGTSPDAYVTELQNSPTAHVTKTALPDGSTRTVIDDPQRQTHATIIRKGSTFSMDVTEPSKSARGRDHDTVSMGSVDMNEQTNKGMSHVTVMYRPGTGFTWSALFLGSVLMGLIVASILAGPLAKENDGHLEMAWTKPASRERYAAASVAIDAGAIVLSQLATIAVVLLATIMWVFPTITLGTDGWAIIGFSLFAPIAWYACLTAFSASLKRGPGMVVGLGWFAALLIPAIYALTFHTHNAIWSAINKIFLVLGYLDPVMYIPSFNGHAVRGGMLFGSFGLMFAALVVLSLAYIALAVLQWRRVEA